MDLHQQNFSWQYLGLKLTCIPNFSQIGQFLQKLSHFIEFWLVGWLGWFAPFDFKKISRCKASWHDKYVYQKSSWYLKAFKSYPIFKMDQHDNDDADTTGGWIIVRSEFLIPSRTKINFTRSISQYNNNFSCIYFKFWEKRAYLKKHNEYFVFFNFFA